MGCFSADFFRTEIRHERFRNTNGAVGLLVLLQQRDVEPRQGSAGSVQRMRKTVFPFGVLEAEFHAAGLILGEA